MKIIRLLLACFLFYITSQLNAAEITSFSPKGTIKKVTQVKVRFSEQMVAFGDPEADTNIFRIDCPISGQARWIDGSTFVYDFKKKFSSGIRCRFSLKTSVRTLKGRRLRGLKKFNFSTGGPAVLRTSPYRGARVDENQIFFLTLDGPVQTSSIKDAAYFIIDGIENRIKAKLLSKTDRNVREILKQLYRYRKAPKNLIILKATQKLPPDRKITIVWGKGIRSPSGIKTTRSQRLNFRTRKPFLANLRCSHPNKSVSCSPVSSIALRFTAPVKVADASKIRLKSRKKTWKPKISPNTKYLTYLRFSGPFPANTKFAIYLPRGIRDDSGRSLANSGSFPLDVTTGEFPPLARFAARFGILESKVEPVLPVTVRNLEKDIKIKLLQINPENGSALDRIMGNSYKVDAKNLVNWLKKVYNTNSKKSIFSQEEGLRSFYLPKVSSKERTEVVGIPLKKPGFYAVELQSKVLGNSYYGRGKRAFIPTTALVTNMAVHFKWGRESSLVWVTSLDKGQPVPGAKISIRDCKNRLLASGKTNKSGVLLLRNDALQKKQYCSYRTYDNGLFAIAERGEQVSFSHTSWSKGIEPWRFNLNTESYQGPILLHTVLARTLLRAGETIHMKHFMRKHNMYGFKLPKTSDLPQKIKITHLGSNEKYSLNLDWDESGTAESMWKIPKEAKLGTYQIRFEKKLPNKKYPTTYYSENFRVEEFRVPLMKASVKTSSRYLVKPRKSTVDIQVKYLSGGGASNLPVKFKSFFTDSTYLYFPEYSEYTFGSHKLRASTRQSNESSSQPAQQKKTQSLTLDSYGGQRVTIGGIPQKDIPFNILTELEFMDPNGEIQTISSTFKSYPSKVLVGIKQDSWASSKDKIKLFAVAITPDGKALPGQKITIKTFKRSYYSHRKRLVGGFYAYDHYREVKALGDFCEGTTNRQGLLICEGKANATGDLIFQAVAKDSVGNFSYADAGVWVRGEDAWFARKDHDRMDILPLKKEYASNDTAKLQVRTPYKNAKLLLTVEREGILDYYVRDLKRKSPFVSIPIKKNYSPNVFISALAIRGRVGSIKPTARIDLGKPSYKLGYAKLKVDWKPHRLFVKLKTKKKVYKVRDKVRVSIQVKTDSGEPLPRNTEVAIVAVDEGLLELKPNNTWKVLQKMMQERGLAVRTSTAQMQVIGRRHFGSKAIEHGGGGGSQNTRELFDTLLYWNPKVKLDTSGRGSITVPLNDSLTSFRIVAIGNSGAGYFGSGSTKIRTNQDLILISGIPPVARSGDLIDSTFTVRNTTNQTMQVEIAGNISQTGTNLAAKSINLQAGEAKQVSWETRIPENQDSLSYHLTASSGRIRDGIRIQQKVVPFMKASVQQATLFQLENKKQMWVNFPKGAIRGKGGINIIYRPSLISGVKGVDEYMSNYPYSCMEQMVSKNIVSKNKRTWKQLMAKLPAYLDSDGLLKYFPTSSYGSPTLTSYVLAIAHEANFRIPKANLNRMIYGLKAFINGSIRRQSSLSTPDLTIRKLSAIEALSRYGSAKASYLQSLRLQPNLLPTSAVLDLWNIRYNLNPNDTAGLSSVKEIVNARLDMQGTTMKFSTERSDNLYWLMVSSDVNAVRLLLTLVKTGEWKTDIGRIASGALQRHKKGAWDLTTANAWGKLAIEKFARTYEKQSVSGTSQIRLNRKRKFLSWRKNKKGKELFVKWPKTNNLLKMSHKGTGAPWVIVQSVAAVPRKKAFSSGYRIEKKLIPVTVKQQGRITKGDIYRVRLTIRANSAKAWVVLDDPIPSGASILGGGLARDSNFATSGERSSHVWPEFVERSFTHYRAYYRYVPGIKWHTEYTIRFNQNGRFQLPATRIEAMYAPEMFGEFPNPEMLVEEK
ncbi:MAG: MG2 domain-containing protein [Spirochaetota bacterium]